MHISEPPKKQVFESILPMINIVFLLLIFFMLAGTLTRPEILSISPPNAHTQNTTNLDNIILSMDANKQLAIETTLYSETEALTYISEKMRHNALITLQLKADAGLASQDLIHIMEKLSSTGLKSIHLLVVTPR